MNNIHYNRIKAVLAEKDKTGTWLSEKMDRNIGTVSRWMINHSTLGSFKKALSMETGY